MFVFRTSLFAEGSNGGQMVFSVVIELLIFTREGRGNEGSDSSYIQYTQLKGIL